MRKSGSIWSAVGVLLLGAAARLAFGQTREVIVPIVMNGIVERPTHYQTTFTVINLSDSAVEVRIEVRDKKGNAGSVFCGPTAPLWELQQMLEAGAELHVSTSADAPLTEAWARITWSGAPAIIASAEVALITGEPEPCTRKCNRPSDEFLSSAFVPAVEAAREFRAPVTITKYRHTAFALCNPSPSETAHVRFKLLDESGNTYRGTSLSIDVPPRGRTSGMAWTFAVWCPPCARPADPPPPEMFHGSAVITSDIPIAVGAFHMLSPEGKFVTASVASTP